MLFRNRSHSAGILFILGTGPKENYQTRVNHICPNTGIVRGVTFELNANLKTNELFTIFVWIFFCSTYLGISSGNREKEKRPKRKFTINILFFSISKNAPRHNWANNKLILKISLKQIILTCVASVELEFLPTSIFFQRPFSQLNWNKILFSSVLLAYGY